MEKSMTGFCAKSAFAACLLATFSLAAAEEATTYVAKTAPFTDANVIAKNIIDECGLPEAMMKVLHEEATAAGVSLTESEEAVTANKGRVLIVETSNAISSGNAFVGHRKQVVIKGRLLENGTELGNFTGVRSSGGGMWGGYKSSCAVLHRCQVTLAKDILAWLKNPTKDARIGE
jgi:hypothetical protein